MDKMSQEMFGGEHLNRIGKRLVNKELKQLLEDVRPQIQARIEGFQSVRFGAPEIEDEIRKCESIINRINTFIAQGR